MQKQDRQRWSEYVIESCPIMSFSVTRFVSSRLRRETVPSIVFHLSKLQEWNRYSAFLQNERRKVYLSALLASPVRFARQVETQRLQVSSSRYSLEVFSLNKIEAFAIENKEIRWRCSRRADWSMTHHLTSSAAACGHKSNIAWRERSKWFLSTIIGHEIIIYASSNWEDSCSIEQYLFDLELRRIPFMEISDISFLSGSLLFVLITFALLTSNNELLLIMNLHVHRHRLMSWPLFPLQRSEHKRYLSILLVWLFR